MSCCFGELVFLVESPEQVVQEWLNSPTHRVYAGLNLKF